MMKSGFFGSLVIASVLSLSALATPNLAEAGGWHKRAKKVCANRLVNKPEWQSGHYAFARSTDEIHCGWAFDRDSKNHAAQTALRACKSKAHTPCKLHYAK